MTGLRRFCFRECIMSYLEQFLEKYYGHIDDYEGLLFILSLLPDSYQYVFAKNLLDHDDCLEDGDFMRGVPPKGVIRIFDEKIFLVVDEKSILLLDLPPSFEV